MGRRNTDHVVLRNGHPFCLHCGQTYKVKLPAPIPVVTGAWNGFIKAHTHCKKTWTEPEPDMTTSAVDRAIWWYENGERGISSETIFANLVKVHGEFAKARFSLRQKKDWGHPSDPSDFYRCYKLLQAVPELRKSLDVMKSVSPQWSALVDNWDKLTEMLEEQLRSDNSNGMYEFMKELVKNARKDQHPASSRLATKFLDSSIHLRKRSTYR